MQKEVRTTYTLEQPNGCSVTVYLEDDHIVVRNLWANGEIESEVNIHSTVGTAADLVAVFTELESVIIGE